MVSGASTTVESDGRKNLLKKKISGEKKMTYIEKDVNYPPVHPGTDRTFIRFYSGTPDLNSIFYPAESEGLPQRIFVTDTTVAKLEAVFPFVEYFRGENFSSPKIENENDWEKYRYLFQMHLNLKLIEQHMRLGRIYDKQVAHFYDQPWKDTYIENLKKALTCYEAGLYYWKEASLWAEKANTGKFRFLFITDLQNWEDERERIGNGNLDYEKILNREIARVQKVISEFEGMDEKTY